MGEAWCGEGVQLRNDGDLMKRLIQGLTVGVLLLAGGFTAAMAAEFEANYRYLIVLENSARMDRQREVALDTVHQLILSGIDGRIQEGEVLGVWTFRDRLDRDQFRAMAWSPGRGRDVANDVYRALRDGGFAREPDLDVAISGVTAVAREVDRLTVFLVVSGGQPIRGTSFDAEINQVYEQHAEAMRKSRRPFVTVLVMERGRAVGHATSPGGRRVYIPPVPAAAVVPAAVSVETPEVVEPEVGPTVSEEPVAVEPVIEQPAPEPRILTVEEIERQLREAERERLRREAAAMVKEPRVPEPDEEEVLAAETSSEVPVRVQDAVLELSIEPPSEAVPSVVEARDQAGVEVGLAEAPVVGLGGREERPMEADETRADGAVAGVGEAPGERVGEVTEWAVVEEGTMPVSGMVVPGAESRWVYLVAGVGLLLAAGMISLYVY
jgi:hypothetical protein